MSKSTATFFVIGVTVSYLVACYRYRLNRKILMLSLPKDHSAEVINLAEWKAERLAPN